MQKIALVKTFEQTSVILGSFCCFRLDKICAPTGISRMDGKGNNLSDSQTFKQLVSKALNKF